MAQPRTTPETTVTEGKKKPAGRISRVRKPVKSESDKMADMSTADRVNYITRNMDRLAPKTRAKLDAYQAEGHAHLPRDNFKGRTPEEIRAHLLSGK